MRKTWIATMAGALALGSTLVVGTTTYSGTVSEIDPSSSTITVRSETSTAPTKYVFTKETVFADPQGHVVSYDTIRNAPVTVYYTREGDRMIVSKVVTTKPIVT